MSEIQLPFNKRTLTNYELILTENCNFRCKYCFDNDYSDRVSCKYTPYMTLEMLPDILNFIEKTRKKDVPTHITFFGGEPTLNWEFIEKFIETVESKKLYFRYNMNTNASTLTPDKVDFLIDKNMALAISIDGIKESHDSSRVLGNGQGTWDSVMRNLPHILGKLKAHNVYTTVMCVVNRSNLTYLEKNYEFLLNLGFGSTNLLWCFEDNFSEDELEIIHQALNNLFIEKRLPLWRDGHRIFDPNSKQRTGYCQHPQGTVSISSRGRIYFCHRLIPKMNDVDSCDYFGDIYKGYTNTEYLSYMRDRASGKNKEVNATCKKCESYDFCKSGCIASIKSETGKYLISDSVCKVQNMLLKFKKDFENTNKGCECKWTKK